MQNIIYLNVGYDKKLIKIKNADHFSLMTTNFCDHLSNLSKRDNICKKILNHAETLNTIKKAIV